MNLRDGKTDLFCCAIDGIISEQYSHKSFDDNSIKTNKIDSKKMSESCVRRLNKGHFLTKLKGQAGANVRFRG
jgi:uncharacterized ubiquitin-like protein YukD